MKLRQIPRLAFRSGFAVALSILIGLLQGCEVHDVEVLRTADQRQANAAVAYLERYGGHPTVSMVSSSRQQTHIVLVPPAQENDARRLLHQLSIPAPVEPELDATGLHGSMSESQIRAVRERQRQLKSTIESIPGVVRAEVTLVLPRHSGMRKDDVKPQASVVVTFIPEANESVTELQSSVDRLVRNGVDGIDRNDKSAVQVEIRQINPRRIESKDTVLVDQGHVARLGLQRNVLAASSAVLMLAFAGLLATYARGLGMGKNPG